MRLDACPLRGLVFPVTETLQFFFVSFGHQLFFSIFFLSTPALWFDDLPYLT